MAAAKTNKPGRDSPIWATIFVREARLCGPVDLKDAGRRA